jgi:hypothetical protein
MDEVTLNQAYLWFRDNGYNVEIDTENLCLWLSVWNQKLEESIDVLLSNSEVEQRAYLYQSSLENN